MESESFTDGGCSYSDKDAQVLCLKSDLRWVEGILEELCHNVEYAHRLESWALALQAQEKALDVIKRHHHIWEKNE